ncbi:MAG: DUF192 domain-containing protein [Syntrophobacterales bacterium]|nr:DUF192 domain-containing protein [Syntrophobacterales bacterium]
MSPPVRRLPGVLRLLAALMLLLTVPVAARGLSPHGNPVITVLIRGVAVTAEVVSSPEKLYLGLSHRPGLPPGHGMLFMLPEVAVQHFCMRDMRFPLDFLWLKDGRVVGVTVEVPADFPGTVTSPEPVAQVLEVPAGFVAAHGIRVGDPVELRP